LLGKDFETNNVAMQRRGKHASTIELLLETVFYARSVQRSYLEENWGHPVSCQLRNEFRKRDREEMAQVRCGVITSGQRVTTEAEESPLLRFITRK
jgi:hypothetical protein